MVGFWTASCGLIWAQAANKPIDSTAKNVLVFIVRPPLKSSGSKTKKDGQNSDRRAGGQ
jgi:hypothetical protein